MSLIGWEPKQGARVIDVHPKKWNQAVTPAFHKIGLLMIADPIATMVEISKAMDRARQQQFEQNDYPELVRRNEGGRNLPATPRPASPSMSTNR